MRLIDSHCHIDGERFDDDREDVIARARASGVAAMLNVGTGSPSGGSFERTIGLAESHAGVFAAIGIHPHDASEYDEAVEAWIIELAGSSQKIIAWGEIGLDFHYDHSPRDVQAVVFRKQIRAASDLGLPIIIHSRSANAETLRILKEGCAGEGFRGGIMHCFGGTAEMAAELIEIGFLISFAGNVTFASAGDLRNAARVVPLGKMLVETDCPYLTPVPYRGKRNEPARVVETAAFLSRLLGIDEEEFAGRTTANFIDFFGLDPAVLPEV